MIYIKRTVKAFSLLEMALVLSIMGIISAYAIPALLHARSAARWKETDAKLEAITYALAGYAQLNKRLPYPANPEANTSNMGMESPEHTVGLIPYRTLGIQQSDAKDGFQHWISYSVEAGLTSTQRQDPNSRKANVKASVPNDNHPLCLSSPAHEPLSVRNEHGESMLDVRLNDLIAFVLVTHGPSGAGSFNDKGKRCDATGDKLANTNGITFVDRPISKDFDDRIRWVSRNNLMAVYLKQPCKANTIKAH